MSAVFSQQKGLTLVELMVTVVVLVIIGTVAYPIYSEQALKARRADAKSALQLIQLAQERYYSANGNYAVTMSSLSVHGATLSTTSDAGYYNLALSNGGNAQTYTATATPDANGGQASDSDCTALSLNQLGTRSATGANTGVCW